MRICFIYPSYVRHSEANPELQEIVSSGSYLGSPTQSVAILAGMTPPHHEVVFYDDRIEAIPFDEDFDLVAMPVFTPAARRAMEIGDRFRARGVQVVCGGIFSSLMPQEMAPHVDAVCIGEGEPVWLEILADAEARRLKPIYRADRPFDLRELPAPRYDLYFEKEGPGGYRTNAQKDVATVDYAVQISRGCPLRCLTCVIPEYMGRDMRFVPPEWVADNFRALDTDGTPRFVSLTEDTTSFPSARIFKHYVKVMEACEGIGPHISYTGASPIQVQIARPEYFEYLRRLNAVSIYLVFGFDQASQNAFAADADPGELQECLNAVKRIYDEGLDVYASLLVGHDNEDESVFDKILEFAHKAKIKTAEFVILTPYPGTPLWHRLVKEERLITRDFSRFNDANPTFRPAGYTADRLREGYLHLWRSFYGELGGARHHIQV